MLLTQCNLEYRGIMLWTNVSPECDKSFNSDEYANLYFVFKVACPTRKPETRLSVDLCREQLVYPVPEHEVVVRMVGR